MYVSVSSKSYRDSLVRKQGAEMVNALAAGRVLIAGLGGLGSNVAMALARAGIGAMRLIDFDVVDLSNINRQIYTLSDIGADKGDALIRHLNEVNPYCSYESVCMKVDCDNIHEYLNDMDVVVEAFDHSEEKAMLVESILSRTDIPIVSASGITGIHNPNLIKTQRILGKLYLVGDGIHGIENDESLMAPRVLVAAGHQATTVCRILMEKATTGQQGKH